MVAGGAAPVHLSGTDRIFHINDIAGKAPGAVILDALLTPDIVPRLHKLAEAYQRIRYHKLVFRVETMVPTFSTGGYAFGFIPDPRDVLQPGTSALSRVMATPGAKLAKSWQSSVVAHKCNADLLYTNEPPLSELRLFSPGRVCFVIDSTPQGGTASAEMPVSIWLEWSVTLSEPSLESHNKSSLIVAQNNFYIRSSNVGLWWRDSSGGDDPRSQIPGIQFDVVYQLTSKRFVDFTDGTTETLGSFDKVLLSNDTVHGVTLWVVDYSNKPIKGTGTKNVWVIEKGDTLTPLPGNSQVGLEHRWQRPLTSPYEPRPGPSSNPSPPLFPESQTPRSASRFSKSGGTRRRPPTDGALSKGHSSSMESLVRLLRSVLLSTSNRGDGPSRPPTSAEFPQELDSSCSDSDCTPFTLPDRDAAIEVRDLPL